MTLVTGLVPDAPTDLAASTSNQQKINAVLQAGNAELPAGVYTIAGDAIRVPSGRTLSGAGKLQTTVRMMSGQPLNLPVITNQGNTDTAHTTPDTNITIRDLTSDGNIGNRASVANPNSNGCAVTLRCVEDSLIENVYALNGNHSIDISASVYMPNDLPVTDPAKRPPGPSKRITVRHCDTGGSGDDAITTHCSGPVLFEHCNAVNHEAKPRSGNSNGFEIDDGSVDVTLVDCFSRGFSTGFAAKGHPQNIPAQRTTFIRCHAEWSRYGFWHFWDGHTAPDGFAFGVTMRDCSASGLGDVLGYDDSLGYSYHPALLIGQYDGVLVENFTMWDSPTSPISISGGTKNVRVNGITSTDCWTKPYQPQSRGVVTITDTAGTNIRVSNVIVRNNGRQRVSAVVNDAADCLVENVEATTGPLNVWRANTAYEVGDYCYPATGVVLAAVKAGTSGDTPPPTPDMNTGVDDGTARWVRVYGSAVMLDNITNRQQVRQVTQTNHAYRSTCTSGTYAGNYKDEAPVPSGWWK